MTIRQLTPADTDGLAGFFGALPGALASGMRKEN